MALGAGKANVNAPNDRKIWALTFGYPTLSDAGPAYETARNIIFSDDVDIDAAVYRVQISGEPVVIIIGIGSIADAIRDHLVHSCRPWWPATVPEEVFETLLQRHIEQRSLGTKVERRAGEPPRIDPL